MSWSLAVFKERGKEVEATVPSCWIRGEMMFWSNTCNAEKDFNNQREPEDGWLCYRLIKVKLRSDDKYVCDNYTFTSEDDAPAPKQAKNNQSINLPQERATLPSFPLPKTPEQGLNVSIDSPSPLQRSSLGSKKKSHISTPPLRKSPRKNAEKKINQSFAFSLDSSSHSDSGCSSPSLDETRNSGANGLVQQSPTEPSRQRTATSKNKDRYPLDDAVFQRKMFSQFAELRNDIKEIKAVLGGKVPLYLEGDGDDQEFEKCETVEEMNELESRLKQNREFKTFLINHLSRQGAANLKETVKNNLLALAHYGVWSQYTYFGTKDKLKQSFSTMEVFQVFKTSVLKTHKDATVGDVKDRVQSFLRYAPDREGGGGRKGGKEKTSD